MTAAADRAGAPRHEPPLALALDLGTSSIRVCLYDRRGCAMTGARARYAWRTTPDGGSEVDADAVVAWTAATIDRALEQARGTATHIGAVGVTTLWHSLVGVGADGRAVTPAYSWSDMRSAAAAEALRARLDPAAVHQRTGAALHPSYLPARLTWLRAAEPAGFRRARHWMSVGEYLALRLFGERRVSLSMASGTGLFDQRALRWDGEVLDAVGITPEQLSPLVDVDAPFRGLATEYAARWPVLATVPWLPAVGDGACANVGSGCITPQRTALSLGTSGALRILSEGDVGVIPRGLWCYRLDRRRVLFGGAVSNAGNAYRWLRATLRLPPPAELEAQLAALSPDAHGLVVLPFLAGERSPRWSLAARAAVTRLTLDATPVDIVRAWLEAVAYRLALVHERLRRHLPGAGTLVASGGSLAGSPTWAQMIADTLGEPLVLSPVREASARGAALLALETVGALPSAAAAPLPLGESIVPDPQRHATYRAALDRHLALEELMSGWEEGLL